MQEEVDVMHRKIYRVKSMREEELERENKILDDQLKNSGKFKSVPIGSNLEERKVGMYKYQLDGDEEDDLMRIPIER